MTAVSLAPLIETDIALPFSAIFGVLQICAEPVCNTPIARLSPKPKNNLAKT
jgi:hypothetical protein